MKRTLLFLFLIPFLGFSQTTRVTTQDGNFLNPLIWSPIGLPASGDSIVIDHDVVMNSNIYYTSGTIYIRSTGRLMEDGTDRSFWSDGGNLINEGVFTAHLLLHSNGGYVENYGTMVDVDSVWNQGEWTNDGAMNVYDILNDETATFENNEFLGVANNFNNQGSFYVDNFGGVYIENNFSNCNLQSLDAHLENNGTFCITNDFSNCGGDELDGTGNYFVGGSSSNLGDFIGSFTFHTLSGTLGIPGNIDPNVTVTSGICNLAIAPKLIGTLIYPNPFVDVLKVTEEGATYQIVDLYGRVMLSGIVKNETIDVSELQSGTYVIQINDYRSQRLLKL